MMYFESMIRRHTDILYITTQKRHTVQYLFTDK
jgi:hypothetical protein